MKKKLQYLCVSFGACVFPFYFNYVYINISKYICDTLSTFLLVVLGDILTCPKHKPHLPVSPHLKCSWWIFIACMWHKLGSYVSHSLSISYECQNWLPITFDLISDWSNIVHTHRSFNLWVKQKKRLNLHKSNTIHQVKLYIFNW